jgi:hypothetical protein
MIQTEIKTSKKVIYKHAWVKGDIIVISCLLLLLDAATTVYVACFT